MVWDEITEQKMMVGLATGLCVWFGSVLLTFPIGFITFFFVPCVMWMALRFFEDAVSDFREVNALVAMLKSPSKVAELAEIRRGLHERVMELAVEGLSLPVDPEKYFKGRGGREKGRVRGPVESSAKYFSIKRRRKRDVSSLFYEDCIVLNIFHVQWNEILRVWPHDE